MRKRWLEKSQAYKETSFLPEESPELSGLSLGSGNDARNEVINVDEQELPESEEFFGHLDGCSDTGSWSHVQDDEPKVEDSANLKRPRILIEDADDCASGSGEKTANKSATSLGVEHLAMRTANLGQFKFPWERKRLAGVFSDSSSVRLEPPDLQPGANSLLNLSIQVKSKADLQLQPVVQIKEPPNLGRSF